MVTLVFVDEDGDRIKSVAWPFVPRNGDEIELASGIVYRVIQVRWSEARRDVTLYLRNVRPKGTTSDLGAWSV